MNARRWKRTFLVATVGLLLSETPLFAQQTDPALTSAVLGQTAALKKIHKDRKKTQEKIIAAEVAVTASLERIHHVEDKMLDYLSNAQGAMQNLYQIKRAGELVVKEIPQNCSLLLKSVGGNLKGTVIAAMVSDELTDAATQMAAHLDGNCEYTQPDYTGASAFLIGNEANGLTKASSDAADVLVRIPMQGQVESFNAAVACTILTFEAVRQRRTGVR